VGRGSSSSNDRKPRGEGNKHWQVGGREAVGGEVNRVVYQKDERNRTVSSRIALRWADQIDLLGGLFGRVVLGEK